MRQFWEIMKNWIENHFNWLIPFIPFILHLLIGLFVSAYKLSIDLFNFEDVTITNSLLCYIALKKLLSIDTPLISPLDKEIKVHKEKLTIFLFISLTMYILLIVFRFDIQNGIREPNIFVHIGMCVLIVTITLFSLNIIHKLPEAYKIPDLI